MKKFLAIIMASCFILLTVSSVYASESASPMPRMTLLVEVDEACKTNVKFTAFFDDRYMSFSDFSGVTVDFYTGSSILCVYPNQYLGSSTMDEKGIAVLGTWQNPGQYAGGAIVKSKVYGEIYSNVFYYEVKSLTPVLNITSKVNSGISGNINNNVTLNANLVYPEGYAGLKPLREPLKVEFYIDNPLLDMRPLSSVGSAYLIDGEAELSVPVSPGEYYGSAVLTDSILGTLYSPQIYFDVPKVGLTMTLKTTVVTAKKPTVNYTVLVSVDYDRPTDETPNWPTGPVKVDFYSGKLGENTPMKLVGSSYTNRSGYASYSFSQSAGEYIGMAIIDTMPYGSFKSDTVEYKVTSPIVMSRSGLLPLFQQFWQLIFKAFGFNTIPN